MLYEASCNKRFIPTEELRDVVGEAEVSTLVKLLRDMHVIVSGREYCDTVRQVRSALNLTSEDDSSLVLDSLSDDGIIALNPAVIEEMRQKDGRIGLGYNMVKHFIRGLLSSMELAANIGSLNDLVKDLATKYNTKFKTAVAKDIVINRSCSLSEVEKASLAAAKLASPAKFENVMTIILARAQRLAERMSLEITQEDVEEYALRGLGSVADSENLVDGTA
jgi:hypothetical protein